MRIVAVVNDEVITQSDLNQAFFPVYLQMQDVYGPEELAARGEEVKKQILEQLIEERLMLQEAKNPRPVEFGKGKIGTPVPIEVSEAELQEMVDEVAAKFEDWDAFVAALGEQGLTLDDLKNRYRNQITVQKLISREIRSRIAISPAEVTGYYESYPERFRIPQAVKVAVIVIRPKKDRDPAESRRLADHLHEQLAKGAEFYDVAAKHSDGANASMGGRIGWIERGKSVKEIDGVLFSLKKGDISPVIQTSQGFHIFRVEETREARKPALDEVKDQVRNRLFEEKMAVRYREWIEKLKQKAYIALK